MNVVGMHGKQKHSVPMVLKTLALLEAFRANGARLSLAEAMEFAGIPKASAFRMLETLRVSGYLSKEGSGRYQLTYKFLEMSVVVHEMNPVRRAALLHLKRLQHRTCETVCLGMLQEDHVVYVEVLQGMANSRRVVSTGSTGALHATALGKAIAAWLPEDQLDHIVWRQGLRRFTPRTIATGAGFREELARVREQGHAAEIEEEALGWSGAGATIGEGNGSPSYAVSIAGPSSRMTPARVSQLAVAVKDVCREVQRACGFAARVRPRSQVRAEL